MCWCDPLVRTPNCGKMSCVGSAMKAERRRAISFIRIEADRMRTRNEGADEAVAAHFDLVADRLQRGEHERVSPHDQPPTKGKDSV